MMLLKFVAIKASTHLFVVILYTFAAVNAIISTISDQ